jgi:4-amino-4-deoxy-L-arabinose transferase-like glycosyltransferase
LATVIINPSRPSAFARITRGWRWSSLAMLTGIWGLTQFWGIFSPPLLDDADSVHVEAVREMVLRHDYVTLYADGVRYFDKPPLPYWMGAASVHIFGMHDWAIRLPLALSVLLLTLYLYQLATRLYGERAGLFSALVFATSIGPYLFTRFFIPDIIVALWMTVAVDLILRMENSASRYGRAKVWHPIAFGLVCAACTLTKGLIGVVFPVGVLLAYLGATGQLRLFFKMRPLTGALTYIVAATPWHWLAAVRNPATSAVQKGWFWFYFINDQLNRYLDKRIPRDYDKVPLTLFWLLLILWLMPWGAWLPAALRRGTKAAREWAVAWSGQLGDAAACSRCSGGPTPWQKRRQDLHTWALALRSPQTLLFVWAMLILLFFSFSTRQEYYTIPAVPALALLTGVFLAREERGDAHTQRPGRWSAAALFVIGACTAAVCLWFAVVSKSPPAGMDLFNALQQDPSHYALSFGHFFDLTKESLGFFRLPLLGTAVGLFLGTGAAWWLRLRRKPGAGNLALAAAMVLVLACAHEGLKVFYPILGSEPLARAIVAHREPGATIVMDGEYTNESSLNFYTQQPVHMLNGRINGLWYGSLFPDAPPVFEDDASFARMWTGPGQVFFVTDHPERMRRLLATYPRGQQLAESGGKWLLVNR